MQAKVNIGRMGRIRKVSFDHLFIGNDRKGEVRTEWSSLYQAFHRNQFVVTVNIAQVQSGGRDIEEATRDFTVMFDRMEVWCDTNCQGLWTVCDNQDELDDNATEVEIEVRIMFENEEDLMGFTRDCAVLMKLTY